MRHAHSDHPLGMRDFDRPLSEKGKKQPLKIAGQLKKRGLIFHEALVSPAQRTRATFEIVQNALSCGLPAIFEERLYNAHEDDVLQVLKEHLLHEQNYLLIGHNPSVSIVCSLLTQTDCDFGTSQLAILRPKESFLSSLQKNSFTLEEVLVP